MEAAVPGRLVGLLQESESYVRLSSLEVITTLAKFGMLIYFGVYKPDCAAEDFHPKMVEAGILGLLVGLLQDVDSYVRQSSVKVITIFLEIGTLIYLAYTRTDRAVEDFRPKMVETDILGCLVGSLRGSDSCEQRSSIEIITTLAKFGMLI